MSNAPSYYARRPMPGSTSTAQSSHGCGNVLSSIIQSSVASETLPARSHAPTCRYPQTEATDRDQILDDESDRRSTQSTVEVARTRWVDLQRAGETVTGMRVVAAAGRREHQLRRRWADSRRPETISANFDQVAQSIGRFSLPPGTSVHVVNDALPLPSLTSHAESIAATKRWRSVASELVRRRLPATVRRFGGVGTGAERDWRGPRAVAEARNSRKRPTVTW